MKLLFLLFAASQSLVVGIFAADGKFRLPPETAKLKPGPGMEIASSQCLLCHSADYISTQPRLNRAAWTAEILKMRDKYGAPILTNRMDALADYLTANYGPPPRQ
jgi:mono/diheme cytochrome c family protein